MIYNIIQILYPEWAAIYLLRSKSLIHMLLIKSLVSSKPYGTDLSQKFSYEGRFGTLVSNYHSPAVTDVS